MQLSTAAQNDGRSRYAKSTSRQAVSLFSILLRLFRKKKKAQRPSERSTLCAPLFCSSYEKRARSYFTMILLPLGSSVP